MNKYMNQKITNFIQKNILKYSKKLNLDLNYFLQSGFWTTLMLIFDLGLGFLFSYFMGNYLTKIESGRFYFFLSLVNIFTIFSLTGYHITATNQFFKKKYNLYRDAIKLKLLGDIVGVIALGGLTFVAYYLNEKIWFYFILVSIIILLSNFHIYNKYLYSKNNFKAISILTISKGLLYYSFTILAIIFKFKTIYIILIYFGIQIIFDLITYFYFYKQIKFTKKKISKKEIKSGKLYSLNYVFNIASGNIDKLILPIFFTLETLAIYSFALIIPKSISQVFDKFAFYLLYKKLNSKKWKELKTKFILFFAFLITASTILIFIIPYAYKIIYPQYYESILYAQLLIGIIPISLFNLILLKYNETNNKPKLILKNNIITQIIQIIAYITLIPFLGIIGVLVGRIIKEIYMFIYYVIKITKNN